MKLRKTTAQQCGSLVGAQATWEMVRNLAAEGGDPSPETFADR